MLIRIDSELIADPQRYRNDDVLDAFPGGGSSNPNEPDYLDGDGDPASGSFDTDFDDGSDDDGETTGLWETNGHEGEYDIVDPLSAGIPPEELEDDDQTPPSGNDPQGQQTSASQQPQDSNDPQPPASNQPPPANDVRTWASQMDPTLIQRANDLGFTINDVASLGSPAAVERAVVLQENALLRRFAPDLDQPQQQQQQGQRTPQQNQQQQPDQFDALIQQMEENDYGPEVTGALKALQAQNQALVQQLGQTQTTMQQTVGAIEQRQRAELEQRRQAAAVQDANWFDGAIQQMVNQKPAFKMLFGEGNFGQVQNSNAALAANRNKVFQTLNQLRSNPQAYGAAGPNDPKLIEAAVGAVFHNQLSNLSRQDQRHQLRQNSGRRIKRSNQSTGNRGLSRREVAERNLSRRMAEAGIGTNSVSGHY